MRTNLVLDDELMRQAGKYSRAATKRALVEEALRTFVQVKRDERRRVSYRDRVRQLRTKTETLDLGESPSAILRAERQRR